MIKKIHITMILSVWFLLSYLITILFNGAYIALVNRSFNLEKILPYMVYCQIDSDYELETLKAQAVIARTNFYLAIREKKQKEIFQNFNKQYSNLFIEQSFGEKWLKYKKISNYIEAVKVTRNQILTYQDEIKYIPYHKMSAGSTRNGIETFHDKDFSYLKSVVSSEDKNAENFITNMYVEKTKFPETYFIKKYDQQGYVREIQLDNEIIDGEKFAEQLKLPSSNFIIFDNGKNYRFRCKGKGHGVGFSQYGANENAKEGYTYKEILKKYFPVMEVKNIIEIY